CRERIVRTPTNDGQFVAQLHHRRPDVVEELNLDNRLQTPYSHSGRTAYDGCFRQLRIEDPFRTELALQARGQLEDPTLAFHHFLPQVLFPAAIGHILAKYDDPLVATHLIVESGVDEIGHRLRRMLFVVSRSFLMIARDLRIER